MTLAEIVTATAHLSRNSGIEVDLCNRSMSIVSIVSVVDGVVSGVCLQGHEADKFIDKYDEFCKNPELEDVDYETIALFMAWDYADILAEGDYAP